MPNYPLVYALVLNYHSLDDTLLCVDSLRQVNYPALRILVLDNASSKNEGLILKQKLAQGEFIQLPKNIGYAGGNNKAIKFALEKGAHYVLILNPDIRLTPDSVQDFVDIMSTDKNIAGLNSIQLQADNHQIDKNFSLGILCPKGFRGNTMEETEMPEQFDSEILFGAALMLSAESIGRVGGFDPLFFAYGEEIDLCRRLRMHNYRLVVTTKSPVIHLRTVYNKPLSRYVLFLKLKGYYLSLLKKPNDSITRVFKMIIRDVKAALAGQAKNIYPYNTYLYSKPIIIKTVIWLIFFLPLIWLHKIQEKKPGPRYIK